VQSGTGEDALHWRVEAACRAAWPASAELDLAGWRLRFASGHSRRANSANPAGWDAAALEIVLPFIEAAYAARGLPPVIRLPALFPADQLRRFEAVLQERGYLPEGDSPTLLADLPQIPMRMDPDVAIRPLPDADWLALQAQWQGWDAATLEKYQAIVTNVAPPAGFMTLSHAGAAALAFARITERMACLCSMVSDPARRRQGHGKRLLGAALAWAIREGADSACLQVEADNAPALALYRAMGFTRTLYAYRYWVK